MAPAIGERIAQWRTDWDAVMAMYMPGQTSFETALFAAAGDPERILDLGGGPGLLAERMATHWPAAAVTLVDLDPVMLALARAGTPDRVTVLRADLSEPSWPGPLRPQAPFDLVTAIKTMHYLHRSAARALYRQARSLMAPGGVLIVADVMPDAGIPAVMSRIPPVGDPGTAGTAWSRWWTEVGRVAEFEPLLRERATLFGPAEEFVSDLTWHLSAARDAGFAEAGVIWRCGSHAALAAVA